MTLVRRYADDTAPTIAYEVVERGRSDGWYYQQEAADLAAAAEARLAKFNIGYVDELSGAWAYVPRGTRLLRERLEDAQRRQRAPRRSAGRLRRVVLRFVREADAGEFAKQWAEQYGVGAVVEGRVVRVTVPPGGPRSQEIAAIAARFGGEITLLGE